MSLDVEEVKETETAFVWQPVMLIAPTRVECDCGAKAIFVQLDNHETSDGLNEYGYVAWCQDCWKRETEGEG
jgi:hypothetical protein